MIKFKPIHSLDQTEDQKFDKSSGSRPRSSARLRPANRVAGVPIVAGLNPVRILSGLNLVRILLRPQSSQDSCRPKSSQD